MFSATADMVLLDDDLLAASDLNSEAAEVDLLSVLELPEAVDIEADSKAEDTLITESTELDEREHYPGHIIFTDPSVEKSDSLIDDLTASYGDNDYKVFTLEQDSDGIEQMSLILAQYAGVKSVHVLSHGNESQLNIGSTRLDSQTVLQYQEPLQAWNNALDESADILLYGCDLAANNNGQLLVQTIATFTQADVAASNDPTGNTELGGDWHLENTTGTIETAAIFAPSWQGLLGTITANDDSANYWHGEIITGNVITGTGGISVIADTIVSAPGEIVSVEYDSTVYSSFVDDEITINAYNGTLVMDRDGTYTFTSNGASASAEYQNWEASYVLYGYVDGADHTGFLSSDLDLGSASVTVDLGITGLGNPDSGSDELDNAEVLVIDLGADYTRAELVLNSLGSSEDVDYTLFASNFSEVDSGSFSGDADGVVSVDLFDNPLLGYDSFRYIALEPEDILPLLPDGDSFRIQEVTAYQYDPNDGNFTTNEVFTYTVDDNDADNGDLQAATLTFVNTNNSNNVPTLSFSGTESEGDTLTAAQPTDADGTTGSSFSYQWQQSDNGNDTWSNISGATSANHILTAGDASKYVRVNATFTDDAGHTENIYSAPSDAINSLASISIGGTVTIDQTISGNVTDADGTSGAITYQWQRSDDGVSSWTNIGSNQNYTLTSADVGKFVRVSASFTDDTGTSEAPVSVVSAQIAEIPIATDDTASFFVGETLSGNVITGEGGSGISADTPGTGPATLSQVEYDSTTYSSWDGDGNLDITTTNGVITFNQDGSYTYSPTMVGVGGDFEWEDVHYTIYGYSMGVDYDTGSLNLGNADALPFGDPNDTLPELYDSSAGLGIRYSDGDDHISDNGIDSDVDPINAETEALAIDFGADARIFQATFSNFGDSESLIWTAYDSLGASVQSGTLIGSPDGSGSTIYSNRTVSVSGDFQYLVFTGDTTNANADAFRIYSISVLDNSPANLDFDYTLTDSDGDSDIGLLSFTYTDDNNIPTLTISGTTNEGDTLTAAGPTDTDGVSGAVTYQWQRSGDGVKNWSDIGNSNSATYMVAGSDDGEYLRVLATYVDDEGTHETIASDVSTQITASNNSPSLGNSSLTVDEGNLLVITSAQISATDPDDNDDNLLFTVSNITNGEFQLISNDTTAGEFTLSQINAGEIKFVHDGSETASGTFDITVEDEAGLNDSLTSQVITVNATNDAPVATDDVVGTDQDTALTSQSVPTPTDVDGTINATSYALVADVAEGNLTFNNDGTYSFNPNGDFDDLASAATRDVTFTYTVDDNDGTTSNTATVTITVTGTNDAPVAGNESVGTDQDTTLNDAVPTPTDIDGTINATSYALVADVSEGSLTFNNDGTYAFNPNGDFDD